MADSQMAHKSQDFKPNVRQAFGSLRTSIIINAVFPVVIYLLVSPHMPIMAALALTAVPPMLYAGYGWVRAHSIDLLSIISLFLIVVSMLIALLVHDPHLFLLKDSFETGAFGLLCLLSLLSPRPLGYYMYRWAFVRTPEQLARLNAGWQVPYARFVRRLVTAVWGLAFVGEALFDTFLVYHLPIVQWMAIHPLLFWGTMVTAFGWAILYSRYAGPKIDASLRQMAQEQAARTGESRQEASKHAVG
jgi:intracellular septation protein A